MILQLSFYFYGSDFAVARGMLLMSVVFCKVCHRHKRISERNTKLKLKFERAAMSNSHEVN